MKDLNFFEMARGKIGSFTERFASEMNKAFNGINEVCYHGKMRKFVEKQGFTQVSAALANVRHITWYEILNDCDMKVKFNDDSDLASETISPKLEVKGSATYTNNYGHWQGGQKYKKYSDKRIYFLSQECYDLDKLCLNKMKITIAFICGDKFMPLNNTTNRTKLTPSSLKEEDIIATHEIIF